MSLPFGKPESDELEFKGAATLDHPQKIVRGVVAFLNGKGGQLWVGIREEHGKAVGLDPILDLPRARSVVRDAIVELVEPTPVELFDIRFEDRALVIEVKRGRERPYALRVGSQREYLGRVADRTRVLSYHELRDAFSGAVSRRDEFVREARNRLEGEFARQSSGFVLMAAAVPRTLVKVNEDGTIASVRRVLQDYKATGSRRLGRTFHFEGADPRFKKRALVTDLAAGDHLRVDQSGDVIFTAMRERFVWPGSRGPDPSRDIHPIFLIELTTSALRILKRFVEEAVYEEPPDSFVFRLGLLGVQGWTLAPGSPGPWGSRGAHATLEDDDAVGLDMAASVAELVAAADRLALTLLKQVYADFGLTDRDLPNEFDQKAGVLNLPD